MKNFRFVEKTSAQCNEDSHLANLHLSRVELHCKLQEKLHRVTWALYEGLGRYLNRFLYVSMMFIYAIKSITIN